VGILSDILEGMFTMVIKKHICRFLCGLTLLLSTGCATVMKNEPSWLNVETNPALVTITLTETASGKITQHTSPFRVSLNKHSNYRLVIDSPHYRSDEVVINRRVSNWFWGNILVGWFVGIGIDLITGNLWVHNPHLIQLNLVSLETAPETVSINIPLTIVLENGKSKTSYLPIVFRKKS
jgi:hypothetical protein